MKLCFSAYSAFKNLQKCLFIISRNQRKRTRFWKHKEIVFFNSSLRDMSGGSVSYVLSALRHFQLLIIIIKYILSLYLLILFSWTDFLFFLPITVFAESWLLEPRRCTWAWTLRLICLQLDKQLSGHQSIQWRSPQCAFVPICHVKDVKFCAPSFFLLILFAPPLLLSPATGRWLSAKAWRALHWIFTAVWALRHRYTPWLQRVVTGQRWRIIFIHWFAHEFRLMWPSRPRL